jgi:poly-beta-1,6-N-acetyl-D-glucosamine biosynthesis protein PgaD
MKKIVRFQNLFVRRVSPLSVPSHIKVRTRPGRPLIRENSWRLDRRARALITTVNLLGWTLWFVLFGLVLTSLAWSAGVWLVRREWVEAEGIRGLFLFLENDLPVGVTFCGVFLLWVKVRSVVMRRNQDARLLAKHTETAKPTETAKAELEASTDEWLSAQQVQCLVCHHDDQGELKAVVKQNLSTPQKAQEVGLKDRLVAIHR